MKTFPTTVSIVKDGGNPIYNCIRVLVNDEAAGSFLEICGDDETNDGAKIVLDWEDWDEIVKVVQKHRKDWEWE